MLPAALKWLRQSASDRTYPLTLTVVAVAFVAAAKFGQSFDRLSPHSSALWPASGIALSAMLIKGYRVWPGIFLGSFIVTAGVGDAWWVCLAIAAIDSLTAALGTLLLKRVFRFRQEFRSPYDVLGFAVTAIICSTFAALLAPLVLIAAGYAGTSNYHYLATGWWASMLMGDAVFTPIVVVYFAPGQLREFAHRYLEAGLIMATLFASSLVVMTQAQPLRYLLFPLMVWAAVRFTQVGVVTGMTIITTVTLWAGANHLGPFISFYPGGTSFIPTQLFLAVLSGTSLIVGMAICELLMSQRELQSKKEQLEQLDAELREANKRIVNILGSLLDDTADRRSRFKREDNDPLSRP